MATDRVKTMKRVLVLPIIILLIVGPSEAAGPEFLSKVDAFVLVDKLLGLTAEPGDIQASLARYREWEAQYIRISKDAHSGIKQMGLYFFIVFIAHSRAAVHTLEEISEEIVPFYERDKDLFLSALAKQPAFTPAVCQSLRSHFSGMGREERLNEFIANNRSLIERHLYKPHAQSCLAELEK